MDYVKFKAKVIDLDTGSIEVLINKEDASELGINPGDRVTIKNNGFELNMVADITSSIVPKGTVGVFSDLVKNLGDKNLTEVMIKSASKSESVKFIRKKIDNKRLDFREIRQIVDDVNHNRLSKVELAGLMTAIQINGLDLDESYEMSKNIAQSGKRLELGVDGVVVDKHSVGGINGRASMIVVPIVASTGLYMPKTSSRAITSCAGTADSMEVLCNVNLGFDQLKKVVLENYGALVWGGGLELAPVDDKLIKIEYPLSLDPHGQVVASVLAKKYCVGSKKVIIDLPVGQDLKISSITDAEKLAGDFVVVGKKLGMDVKALITNGSQPSGPAFGPALEAKHAMQILEGKIYDNLADKAIELAGRLIELGGKAEQGEGVKKARSILESGKALTKMKKMIELQGKIRDKSTEIPVGEYTAEIRSSVDGYIHNFKMKTLVDIARHAGAPYHKGSGLVLNVRQNDKIQKDDLLYTIYSDNKQKLEDAVKSAHRFEPLELQTMILKEL